MAKRKPPPPKKIKRPSKPPQLYERDLVACMPPPNHMLILEDSEDFDRLGLYYRWPLVMLETKDRMGVFVDCKRHKTPFRYVWQDHPPTWMDPHLFIEMCWADPRVKAVCEVAFKKNDPNAWKRLAPLMQEVFDNEYLPYIIEHFEQQALEPLAQWLLRRHAMRMTDPKYVEEQERKRKRARKAIPEPVE